jgi:hypothetical protein
MTSSLGELLQRGADSVTVPSIDLDEVIAEARRRRQRRRYLVVATAAAAVSAIVVGSVLVATTSSRNGAPQPAGPPSPSIGKTVGAEGTRPLVYSAGRTVHVGDKSIRADKPVAFIAPTDDGAVYEATLDGTLWFTDGSTTQVIGTSWFAAAPTSHGGVVVTGRSGSLVVWADASLGRDERPVEFVVYDTSRREEVGRIPIRGLFDEVDIANVGESEVWWGTADWHYSEDTADSLVYRFDVGSGVTTELHGADLDAVLDSDPRAFRAVTGDGRVVHGSPSFTVQGNRLVAGIYDDLADEYAEPVKLADGSELRLRLPPGYVQPWPADGDPEEPGGITLSQWLDDDHVVLFADDGGGDLPAKEGDLLTCELPGGTCQVTVPRSSQPYVAPYLG